MGFWVLVLKIFIPNRPPPNRSGPTVVNESADAMAKPLNQTNGNGCHAPSSLSPPPEDSPYTPKQANGVLRRRLIIASIFAIICIRRWHRDLNSISNNDGLMLPSPPSSLPLATVAYAVSITSCSPKLAARLYDAAAVLRRSIQLNSYPMNANSRYGAKFYAFSLNQDSCTARLSLAGWEVLLQDPPIYRELIKEPKGSVLKMGIGSDGCCGDRELIKLVTYKLIDHEMAVHLDLDTLVVHPMDELFNVMHFTNHHTYEGKKAREELAEVTAPTYLNRRLTGNPAKSGNMTAVELLWNITVDAYFTKDYNMIVPGRMEQRVGMQGGFLVVRPSMDKYTHLINLVYSGEFYSGFDARSGGWFKSGYGRHIWGSMTIQGLMSYYFDVEQLEHSVELNRCRYNNIADNARVSTFSRNPKFPRGTLLPFARNETNSRYNFHDTRCRDGRDECDDTNCQRFPLAKMRVLHYTYCKNPWKACSQCGYLETYKEPTCYAMLREWFRVRGTLPGEGNITKAVLDRADPEHDMGPVAVFQEDGEVEVKTGNCLKEFYLGYCPGGSYIGMEHRNLSAVDVAVTA